MPAKGFLETLATELFRYMALVPDPEPSWRASDFDFDKDYKRLGMMESILVLSSQYQPRTQNSLDPYIPIHDELSTRGEAIPMTPKTSSLRRPESLGYFA